MLLPLLTAALAQDGHDAEQAADAVLVVTSERSALPASQSTAAVLVLTREDIEASGAQSLDELLEMLPGLDVVPGYRGPTLRIRGMDPSQTLLMVDGQRTLGRVDGGVDLRRFTLDEIERVEVVKGAGSALYGADALGGVVHVITRAPDTTPSAQLRGRVGSLPSTDLSAGVEGGTGSLRARGDAGLHASAPVRASSGEHTIIDGARQVQASGAAQARPSADLRLDAQLAWAQRHTWGVDASATGAVLDREVGVNTWSGLLAAERLGARARWSLSAGLSTYQDFYLSDQRGASELDALQLTREQLGEVHAKGEAALGRHHLVGGVDGLAEAIQSDRISKDSALRLRGAPYLQDRVLLGGEGGPQLALTPAMRVDVDTSFGVTPSPKLGALLGLSEQLQLRASAGRGYRAPSFREQHLLFVNAGAGYQVEGDPALRPETSLGGDLELRWSPRPGLRLELGGYWTALEDLINVEALEGSGVGPTRYRYANVDAARSRGLELGARVSLPAQLSLSADYHLNDTLDRATGQPLEGRALHQGSAGLRWRPEHLPLSAAASAKLIGARSFTVADTVADTVAEAPTLTEPLALLDLRLAWTSPAGPELSLSVDNLLDAGDEDLNLQRPRELTLGFSTDLSADRFNDRDGQPLKGW